MIILTVVTYIDYTLVPLHLSITAFSLSIIIIGSYGSLEVMIMEFKKVYLQGKKSDHIESVSAKDAMQFPIVAGVMLCSLYALLKFFGKDSVNYFILAYIGLGSSTGIKALLQSITGDSLNGLDEVKLIDIKTKYFELTITILDLICIILSLIQVIIYFYSKSWIYNNILAIVFCIHAL